MAESGQPPVRVRNARTYSNQADSVSEALRTAADHILLHEHQNPGNVTCDAFSLWFDPSERVWCVGYTLEGCADEQGPAPRPVMSVAEDEAVLLASEKCPVHGEEWVPGDHYGRRRCTFYIPELGAGEDYGCPQPQAAPCCQKPWPPAALAQTDRKIGDYTHICGRELTWDGHVWKLKEVEPRELHAACNGWGCPDCDTT